MATIKVVLAEDNALLREGISRIIDGEPDFDLVGRAADLPELLAVIEDASPQVVVTDIRMPPTGTDEGIQAARGCESTSPMSVSSSSASTRRPRTRWPSSKPDPLGAPTC